MQIFCFTFAGGTTAFYSQVEKYITPEIKIEKLEYAGHGLRYKEAFYNDFLELAEDMYSQIVSTQTWVHTIKKTRIVAGFQDIFDKLYNKKNYDFLIRTLHYF